MQMAASGMQVNKRAQFHDNVKCCIAAISFVLTGFACDYGARAGSPHRVVSVFLCTDEYVFRLVPRERIAALSFLAADHHPVVSTIADQVEGIPLIHQSAEEVLAAKPDVVVLDSGVDTRVRALIKQAGLPTIDVPWTDSLEGIRKVTRQLAAQLGVPERGEVLLKKMDSQLAIARASAPDPPIQTLLYEPNGYTVAGGLTNEVMYVAGLKNAATAFASTRLGTISVEQVVARPPELLILNGDPAARDSRAALVLHHPALKALPARTHVEWLTLTPLLCPGPWSASSVADFSRAARATRH
jgi:iron complex transport system substrate-binding protein